LVFVIYLYSFFPPALPYLALKLWLREKHHPHQLKVVEKGVVL